MKKTIGGNRLGSGKKMSVQLKSYERSTHDLGYIWRSTMASGTLVPFMTELGLPGDTFDIKLDLDIKTHPTIGPLFGSYKAQIDIFIAPIRLYQGLLHNDKLGLGLKMNTVKLPQIRVEATEKTGSRTKNQDNTQVNPSCILSYLGIRGCGRKADGNTDPYITRFFNAVPYIQYWDIYKNYYANKQEEIGAVIHVENGTTIYTVTQMLLISGTVNIPQEPLSFETALGTSGIQLRWETTEPTLENIYITLSSFDGLTKIKYLISEVFNTITENVNYTNFTGTKTWAQDRYVYNWGYVDGGQEQQEPKIVTFPLNNLDQMREQLQMSLTTDPFLIKNDSLAPYGLCLELQGTNWAKLSSQEGLAIKTYQSDIYNNWMNTEWLNGEGGINELTSIDTSSGSFTIDTLNLSKKVYNMLNRIAISGGSYNDWIDTVYTHEGMRRVTTPVYMGGLSKELIFQEVFSTAETADGSQPLGTLAGRGQMSGKHKGGYVSIKVDEPSYIMGIVSLTPRIDYSQGNKWDTNLKTIDDFHKPELDEIGFQNLISDQMAWWDTEITAGGVPVYKVVGQQPAWLNYMTNVNQTRGNFAIQDNEMFMTLNRRYENNEDGELLDATTYIDPVKFNYVFAETARDAQNFWVQISTDITARRKMSARIMPNL